MKKLLTNLSLAAATILLLGSCAKINERIDELEGRINGLEKESIASISTQIESINSSIADLGTIRTNIQNLTSTTAAQAQDIKDLNNEDTEIGKKISDLKKADESINARIDDLQKYVNDTLKAYATTEWVNATFSTLAQYEATCDTIAKIDARIGSMDTRLSKSIEDCADSLKSWVNVQLDGYYTIAQMDAKVAKMNAQIDTLSSTSAVTADSLKAEIAATKAEIDTVKANIRAEYKSAIETAITELNGKLSNELQTKISQVNLQIGNLTTSVNTLQSNINALTGRVEALEAMIQSVVIVPAYSDGSVKVDNDSLYLDCIVSPDTVVKNITKENISILINKVKTKAFAGVDTLKIVTGDLFEKDETNGSISIRVNIAEKLPASADSTITVALNIKNGNLSDYTTDFAPVNYKPLPAGALKGKFTVNAEGKQVHFSQGNLWYGKVGSATTATWNFETNQYDFTTTTNNTPWNADHISRFFWSKTESVAYADRYNDSNATTNDVFFTNDPNNAEKANSSFKVNDVTGKYRTLSKDEWNYLLNTRAASKVGETENARYAKATVNSIAGIILLPDTYAHPTGVTTLSSINTANAAFTANSYNLTEWETMESAGVVFLPAAGDRENLDSHNVLNIGCGRYWSSSTYIGSTTQAYKLNILGNTVDPSSKDSRGYGFCIRLVTDAE